MLETYWDPVWLTLRLATMTTLLLLLIGTPIAWWLARTRHWLRQPVAAVVALPLVGVMLLGLVLVTLAGSRVLSGTQGRRKTPASLRRPSWMAFVFSWGVVVVVRCAGLLV